MTLDFIVPIVNANDAEHHAQAAQGNAAVAEEAVGVLRDALSGDTPETRILLRAAAGAGKSFVLKRLVTDCLLHPAVARVSVVAFTNNQLYPLAESLGSSLGRDVVCLFSSQDRVDGIPEEAANASTVVTKAEEIPDTARVVISTVHKLKASPPAKLVNDLGPGGNGDTAFDVLFVDEAWQVPHHLFDGVSKHALIWVGVGDVGQIPPLEVGANPWRGDPGHNPYRAWPTDYDDGTDPETWVRELPAVWRPTVGHLDVWRAFYPDWDKLSCVSGPGDRWVEFGDMHDLAKAVWSQVTSGAPTLLVVDGLPAADAADVDLPLLTVAEELIAELLAAKPVLHWNKMDDSGTPTGEVTRQSLGDATSDPMVAILATRNQAVNDAADAVERLVDRFSLKPTDLVSSTVDSWQGQTNGITVAVHPLSGASALDEFNSAFGRLAVACTRATHGLLMLTRPGLDELLAAAPARPGTAIGEPGFRTLPRQTHQRILASFARGTLTWTTLDDTKGA